MRMGLEKQLEVGETISNKEIMRNREDFGKFQLIDSNGEGDLPRILIELDEKSFL